MLDSANLNPSSPKAVRFESQDTVLMFDEVDSQSDSSRASSPSPLSSPSSPSVSTPSSLPTDDIPDLNLFEQIDQGENPALMSKKLIDLQPRPLDNAVDSTFEEIPATENMVRRIKLHVEGHPPIIVECSPRMDRISIRLLYQKIHSIFSDDGLMSKITQSANKESWQLTLYRE